jgi:hypothetical protein
LEKEEVLSHLLSCFDFLRIQNTQKKSPVNWVLQTEGKPSTNLSVQMYTFIKIDGIIHKVEPTIFRNCLKEYHTMPVHLYVRVCVHALNDIEPH